MPLKDIAFRIKGSPITATQMRTMAVKNGDIKLFGGGATMVTTNRKFVKDFTIINEPSVLIKSRGIIDVEYCDTPYTFKQEMWAYKGKEELDNKYLYYFLQTKLAMLQQKGSKMGSLPQIKIEDTESIMISLPSIHKQKEIVEKLDAFYDYCFSITDGLQGEIELRKKQFEYYRDKLLAFECK